MPVGHLLDILSIFIDNSCQEIYFQKNKQKMLIAINNHYNTSCSYCK